MFENIILITKHFENIKKHVFLIGVSVNKQIMQGSDNLPNASAIRFLVPDIYIVMPLLSHSHNCVL